MILTHDDDDDDDDDVCMYVCMYVCMSSVKNVETGSVGSKILLAISVGVHRARQAVV